MLSIFRIILGSNNFEGLSCSLESLHATGYLLSSVTGTQLNSDSGFSLGNNWIAESDHENVFFKHPVG